MADNDLESTTVLPNTDPALFPGPEPLIGQYVTLQRFARDHVSDLWNNVGSHDNVWTWWPRGPFSTPLEFVDYTKAWFQVQDLAVYAVVLNSGLSKGEAVGCVFTILKEPLSDRVSEIGALFGPSVAED